VAELNAHAIGGGVQLLEVRYVGADAESISAAVLNFEVRQIELRLASGDQADPRSLLCESDSQPLADSPAATGHKDVLTLELQTFPL